MTNFGRVHFEEQFCEIILKSGQWFRRRCRLKDFLSGALTVLLFVQHNHLCNFERDQHGDHSCTFIWYLDQWFKSRCRFKNISYLEL